MTSHLEVLKTLRTAKPATRKGILATCNCSLIRCLVECCVNTLEGNVPLDSAAKRRLRRFRALLHRVAKPGESVAKKRKLFVQKGNGAFLAALLTPLIGAIIHQFMPRPSETPAS